MDNWQAIPVILNNRNRLDSLRRMVAWLLAVGCTDIRILDNDSTYPPLLSYYDRLPAGVSLQRLGENIGPWAFWQRGLHKGMTTPYIVSDADLVPADFCPDHLIRQLAFVASRFPDCGKVAPGLRVDTISPNYGQRVAAFQFEARYWSSPVASGLFSAPVDTTFALYPAGAEFTNRGGNLRLGYPYLLEHTPWQVEEDALTEEEMFYRAHTAKTFSHWSSPTIDPRIAASEWIQKYDARKTILHLGCGNEYIPGWVNVDVRGRKLDVRFDLDSCRTARLPLEDDSVDGFYLCHSFQHVRDTPALMQELYRVAKRDAAIHLRVPYGSSNDAWEDPGCVRPYFELSFAHFSQPSHSRTDPGYTADWQARRLSLIVEPSLYAQGAEAAIRQIRSSRNVVSEMVVELSAVKPARPRQSSLVRNAETFLSADPRIAPSFSQ